MKKTLAWVGTVLVGGCCTFSAPDEAEPAPPPTRTWDGAVETIAFGDLSPAEVRTIEIGSGSAFFADAPPDVLLSEGELVEIFALCSQCGLQLDRVEIVSHVERRLEPGPRISRELRRDVPASSYVELDRTLLAGCGTWSSETTYVTAAPTQTPAACPDCGAARTAPTRAEVEAAPCRDRPIAWYSQWIPDPLTHPEALNERAWSHARREQWTAAVVDLERSLAVFPAQEYAQTVRDFLGWCRAEGVEPH